MLFRLRRRRLGAAIIALTLLTSCGTTAPEPKASPTPSAPVNDWAGLLPGMPPPLDPKDLYAADRELSDVVKNDLVRVYVPNHTSNTVTVIDPMTYKVIATVPVGRGAQHVVPSYDLRTLWVNNNIGNSLTPIDPLTGAFGTPVPVEDPYNLYFSPDGRYAIVMAEGLKQITFRDPHTMALKKTLQTSCDGVNHADFSPDGKFFIVTCEFSGDLIKVDTQTQEIIGTIHLPAAHPQHAMPQDIKIAPDGKTWYIADMQTSGLWILDGDDFAQTPRFLATGKGAHGLYVSRDSQVLYIANRGEGSISVLDFATRQLIAKWQIPGGGSPDMGNVSADGKVLWLSGRYNDEVYAIDTTDGHLIARIKVGREPHGLTVWPQPGRYSLGHTGILR
jgi:YVTN family beta-propeller protein